MNPSTKTRATLFAGALTIACGIVLVSRRTDWFRPLPKMEGKKSCSRDDNTSSNDDKRDKSDPDSGVEADEGRLNGSSDGALPDSQVSPMVERKTPAQLEPTNNTAVTSIRCVPWKRELSGSAGLADAILLPGHGTDGSREHEGSQRRQKFPCPGLQELCSILDAPPVEENIGTRITQPRIQQQIPPSHADPMVVTGGDAELLVEQPSSGGAVQGSSPGVEHAVPPDGSSSSLPSPQSERQALNPLAAPFLPRRRLNPQAQPFQLGRRRLNPNAAPFDPSQGFC